MTQAFIDRGTVVASRTDVATANVVLANLPNGSSYAELRSMALQLNVSAASGTTPSMTVVVQYSADGGATWDTTNPVASFTAVTATGQSNVTVLPNAKFWGGDLRAVATITGTTPSFTWNLVCVGRGE